MSLKDRIEKRIIMVEYLIETNCNMQHFIKKFNVTTNIFYQLRVIANDNKKFEELIVVTTLLGRNRELALVEVHVKDHRLFVYWYGDHKMNDSNDHKAEIEHCIVREQV